MSSAITQDLATGCSGKKKLYMTIQKHFIWLANRLGSVRLREAPACVVYYIVTYIEIHVRK